MFYDMLSSKVKTFFTKLQLSEVIDKSFDPFLQSRPLNDNLLKSMQYGFKQG